MEISFDSRIEIEEIFLGLVLSYKTEAIGRATTPISVGI